MLRTACVLLVVCVLGSPFARSVEASSFDPSSSFESFDCLESPGRYTEPSPAGRTSMARGRWTILFVAGFGVCPLLAPGAAPEAPSVPALDVPPAPARTAPASRPRDLDASPAEKRPSPSVIPSRPTASAAPLVQGPAARVLIAGKPEQVVLAAALPAPEPRFAPPTSFAPYAARVPETPLAPRPALRPAPLVPLYASFAALQGLDYASTRSALENGGQEANPLMRSIVKNRPAFIAMKAAATAGVIVAGEKMWKKNRLGAVLFVAGANAAMAIVVGRNYAVR
jgi:hypothetical protein